MKSLAIARNTFREALRDKIFGLVVAFGLLMVLSSVVMSPLTVGAQNKIVADMGLASISLFALLVILFVGSGMLHKEMDKRTIMTILAKPISRLEYLLGKYLGLTATLVTMMAGMFAIFLLACVLTGTPIKGAYAVAVGLIAIEMMVVTAVAIVFSTFSTPVLSSLLTLGVFLAGHTMSDLESFARVTGVGGVESVAGVVKWIVPNLETFNVRAAAVHDLGIDSSHVLWALAYGALYIGALMVAADLVFKRREFK